MMADMLVIFLVESRSKLPFEVCKLSYFWRSYTKNCPASSAKLQLVPTIFSIAIFTHPRAREIIYDDITNSIIYDDFWREKKLREKCYTISAILMDMDIYGMSHAGFAAATC